MAITHLPTDGTKGYGSRMRSAVNAIDDGLRQLNDLIETMGLMINGDGSQAVHFDYIVTQFGFTAANGIAANEVAKAAWQELLSLQGKLNVDSAVSNVHAAIRQAAARLR